MTRLIDSAKIEEGHDKRIRTHLIEAEHALKPLSASSKFNAEWAFLVPLRDIGRDAATAWLDANADRIGRESTLDIRAVLDGRPSDRAGKLPTSTKTKRTKARTR